MRPVPFPAHTISLNGLHKGKKMTAVTIAYRERALAELDALPDEYLPFAWQLMRAFRESVSLKSAAASLRQGWEEAQRGDTYPVSTLWDDIDAG
jgi:hypothetical protein